MSPSVQSRGCARRRRQRADHPVVVDQRRDEVAGELEDAFVALVAVAASSRASARRDCPVRRTSPTQPSATPTTGRARATVVGQAGPGRDHEPLVLDDPDRDVVDAQGAPRLIDDRAEQLAPVVRGGQPLGDVEDGVETLGELGLERRGDHGRRRADGRRRGRHHGPGPAAPGRGGRGHLVQPPEDRRSGRGWLETRAVVGIRIAKVGARAHGPPWSHPTPRETPHQPYGAGRSGGTASAGRDAQGRTARMPSAVHAPTPNSRAADTVRIVTR